MGSITSARSGACMVVTVDGRIVQTCGCAWDRLFRAWTDLFLAEAIGFDYFNQQVETWAIDPDFPCPAARRVLGLMILACDEPNCLHDPYRDDRCGCSPMDRRERLREMMANG